MTHPLQRIAGSLVGATLLAVPLTAGAAPVARADTPCTITGFTPRTVTVGLEPESVTFSPTVTGCTLGGWSLEGGDYAFYTHDAAPQNVFTPAQNSDTAPLDVVVSAYNSAYDERAVTYPDAFVVKRRTVWDRFNASPEPVRKGAKITISGRLRMADWESRTYAGYPSRSIAVEFRTRAGSYRRIATVTTGAGGQLTTTVTAAVDGYWRLRYGGNSLAGASTVAGDFVDVR